MIARLIITAAMLATPTLALAQSWYVLRGADRQCYVSDQLIRGYGKLGGPYGSKTSANAAKERFPACDKVNTDPSPGDSGSAR
jgi:hypothetical protein